MSNNKGLSIIEAIVAILVGAIVVLAIGGLGGRLFHYRTTTSSNSAAMNIAERQMETLLGDPLQKPPAGCTVAQALCGDTSSTGRLHGPTRVDVTGAPAAGGEFTVSYWVKDNSGSNDSPLLQPPDVSWTVKQLRVRVTHVTNREAAAELVRYVTILD